MGSGHQHEMPPGGMAYPRPHGIASHYGRNAEPQTTRRFPVLPGICAPPRQGPSPAIRLGLARAHDAGVHTQQLSLDADTFTLTLALRRQHDPLACFTCPAPT
ncbi:uncharacterized protein Tco025E_07177, partial [Trypanosoma conorhini]